MWLQNDGSDALRTFVSLSTLWRGILQDDFQRSPIYP